MDLLTSLSAAPPARISPSPDCAPDFLARVATSRSNFFVPGALRGEGHGGGHTAIAFQERFRGDDGRGYDRPPPVSIGLTGALETVKTWLVATSWAVRRLTPLECERLQGFPDNHTLIPLSRRQQRAVEDEMAAYYRRTNQDLTDADIARLACDGPRYKALGNSMAVNCMRWIGQRIDQVERLGLPDSDAFKVAAE